MDHISLAAPKPSNMKAVLNAIAGFQAMTDTPARDPKGRQGGSCAHSPSLEGS